MKLTDDEIREAMRRYSLKQMSEVHWPVAYGEPPAVVAASRWIVNTKGGPGETGFEICVVRENNTHGQRSYGWFDENKLLVTHNGGPCTWPLTKEIWDACVRVAHAEADRLNRLELIQYQTNMIENENDTGVYYCHVIIRTSGNPPRREYLMKVESDTADHAKELVESYANEVLVDSQSGEYLFAVCSIYEYEYEAARNHPSFPFVPVD